MNRKLIYECRCDERLKVKAEGSTYLTYSGLCGELEHLKIEMRLIDERFYVLVWILLYCQIHYSQKVSQNVLGFFHNQTFAPSATVRYFIVKGSHRMWRTKVWLRKKTGLIFKLWSLGSQNGQWGPVVPFNSYPSARPRVKKHTIFTTDTNRKRQLFISHKICKKKTDLQHNCSLFASSSVKCGVQTRKKGLITWSPKIESESRVQTFMLYSHPSPLCVSSFVKLTVTMVVRRIPKFDWDRGSHRLSCVWT